MALALRSCISRSWSYTRKRGDAKQARVSGACDGNVRFGNAGIGQISDFDLRLGLAEALDAQTISIINAPGMTAGGTGSSLTARIRTAGAAARPRHVRR